MSSETKSRSFSGGAKGSTTSPGDRHTLGEYAHRRVLTTFWLLVLLAVAACGSADQIAPSLRGTLATGTIAVQAHDNEPQTEQDGLLVSTGYADTPSNAAVEESLEDSLIQLYRQANPAVVYIIVSADSSGSGFVISDRGYIVTNNHVVADGRSFEVVFSNGERKAAELVGADPDSDLAVIQVADMPDGIQPLPLAEADTLQVGQFVAAIGNPFGEQGSMSLGIVSGLDRSLPSQRELMTRSSYSLPQVIQTDAPINPGNSGGPLLSLDGQVVGINAAIASTTGTGSGVGFSIPVGAVQRIVPALIRDGKYEYPYIGASFDNEITLGERSNYGLSETQGAYLLGITSGGPAERAGLIPADPNTGRGGDLIVEIDGQPVQDFSDLNSYLVFHTAAGQEVSLKVLRAGEVVEVPLVLGVRP